MEILEWLLAVIFAGSLLYPIGYCFYRRVPNKLFYLSSVVGVSFVVHSLLALAVLPIALVVIKIIPQLAENGVIVNILPLLQLVDVIHNHYFLVLTPVLCIALPHLIRRRYAIFT
ncbi:hypothetical protein [Gilvimarinus xylanilyticus]|uniref:Uncharacterized protein n=1 Tax=Gilvimarinus xylanilyticus TaxID=2944139 RepID=A0A9X2I409_9GAMM|nr:hypothetical protein [Gilvimarinus xylanilyticus]MCP8900368.1 hypothetical protein [Gilvimarinus xylanilyticus]